MSYIGKLPRFSKYQIDPFVSDGIANAYTLTETPAAKSGILVTVDGVKQHQDKINLTGNVLSFVTLLTASKAIEVVHLSLRSIQSGIDTSTLLAQITDNDGAGSGIDADLVDGYHATQLANVLSRNSVQNQDPVSQGLASRSGFESLIGAATSGVITTGDDNGFFRITKDRNNSSNWVLSDSVHPNTYLSSNNTAIEVATVPTINADDITYTWQTIEKAIGYTSRGKAYTAHYNAPLGISFIGWLGDALSGHSIPHHLGREPDLIEYKNRDTISNWGVQSNLLEEDEFLILNLPNAAASSDSFRTTYDRTHITIGSNPIYNGLNQNISAICYTSIKGVSEVGIYNGSGIGGKVVKCGFKVGLLKVKNLTSGATQWIYVDGSRGANNAIQPNLPNAQATIADLFRFTSDGFVCSNNNASTNGLNNRYLFVAFAESTPFDGTKTLTSYSYPTSENVLTINEGTLISYANGFQGVGQSDFQEFIAANSTLTLGAGYENKTLYVYKDYGQAVASTEYRNLEGISRNQADKYGNISILDGSTRTTNKHFEHESPTGVISASSEFTPAWHAFSKSEASIAGTLEWTATSNTDSWLAYHSIEPRVLKTWRIRTPSIIARQPRRFIIAGSFNGNFETGVENTDYFAIDSTYRNVDYVGNGLHQWGDI
jgi:hypothetical protein